MIYLDNAATTCISDTVLEVMRRSMEDIYGNASSVYALGRQSRKQLENARRTAAEQLGCTADEVYFASGGTEGDNWAIKGTAFAQKEKGRHIITTAIEHHAVLHTCEWLQEQGWDVTYLPVGKDGIVDPDDVKRAIRKDTVLISVMTANNEVGSLQPIDAIGSVAREHDILFHTDAVQAIGAVEANTADCDMMSLSAHKFHGPKGIGILYIRKGIRVDNWLHGGAQERSRRPSTENVPAAMGLACAMKDACENRQTNAEYVTGLRDMLIDGVLGSCEGAMLNGSRSIRLPGNADFSFPGIDGDALVMRLDLIGIAASSGSACTSGASEPSHVLKALGVPDDLIRGSVRFSVGRYNTEEEIRTVLEKLPGLVSSLKKY